MTTDPYRQLVVEEAYGRASEDAKTVLAQDLTRWKLMLVEVVEQANADLALTNAEWDAFRVEQRGPDEYRRRRAQVNEKKAKLGHFKRKVEARLRYVNAELGGMNGSHKNPWRELVRWILGDYQDDEWDGLFECVPAELRPVLEIADRDARGEREPVPS